MALADEIFINNCKNILANGHSDANQQTRAHWPDGRPAHTISLFGLVNRYDLSVEFPALTLRKLYLSNAVDEVLWIWQKKSNKVSELRSRIWDSWAKDDGTLGHAYGYQLGIKHIYPEGEFDQVDKLLYDLENNPSSRRIIANMYNHQDLHEMSLYPCAYSLTLSVKGGRLNGVLNQRSQDFLVANNWNVCQYAALLHMFAIHANLKVGELVHVIADAHIYDRHIDIVKALIKQEPQPAPKLIINPDKQNFYDFTYDDFKLDGYKPHNFDVKMEVAI